MKLEPLTRLITNVLTVKLLCVYEGDPADGPKEQPVPYVNTARNTDT